MRVVASISAIALIAGAIIWGATHLNAGPQFGLDILSALANSERLEKEISISSNRLNAVQILGSSNIDDLHKEFEELSKNSLLFMDPEGMESLLAEFSELGTTNASGSTTVETLKAEASRLLGERARKRRFDAHQLLQKVEEIDLQLDAEPDRIDLLQKREALMRTRASLLSEYPLDAVRAIALNPNNSRAIYDLCRFMQDKVGSYDRRVVIKNFERVIELRSGAGEKDGDFLNANINLTVLYAEIGDDAKARCYSAQTLEKHLARSRDDYDYLFGFQPDGRINEPEYREVTNRVNPSWSLEHPDCRK